MTSRIALILMSALMLMSCFLFAACSSGGGGGGDDDAADSTDDDAAADDDADDDTGDCIACQLTSECVEALGAGWGCVGDCCVELGDDDASDDDVDDDTVHDDDIDDDADDDTDDVWTDSLSGLTWQVTPPSLHSMWWEAAKSYCDNLSLAGGGWHLPTISELRTLIRGCDGTVTSGSCGVTDDCLDSSSCWDESCNDCDNGDGPNHGCYGPSELPVDYGLYWSSSASAGDEAWSVYFYNGSVQPDRIYQDDRGARCVR